MTDLASQQIVVIGDQSPLAAELSSLVPGTRTAPWADPQGPPEDTSLCLVAPHWATEPDAPEAVLDDLDVAWAWLNPWVPLARERGSGSILYVVSLDGICGTADNVLLAERDSAFLAQARAMAMELGRFGIRSNCLAVGPLQGTAGVDDEQLAKNPMKRVGTWADAARSAAFLLGDASSHVSGQLLVCAGGADVGRIIP